MDIAFSGADRTLYVKIKGELDHHSSGDVRRKIEREMSLSNYIDIIFDFSELGFMDSSGIGMIIGRYKSAEKLGGKVAVVAAGTETKRIMEISGLSKIINCHPDISSAEKALKTVDRRG